MRRAVLALAAVCAVACGRADDDAGPESAPPPATVPGVETAVALSQALRDVVRAPGQVAAESEPPEVRDARAALLEAEARRTLAAQQVERLTGLARGAIAPRKELEAARAEEAGAMVAAARARQALAVYGAGTAGVALGADETWVTALVLQRDLPAVAAGAETRFTPDAYPNRSFTGRVDAAPAYVDPTTRLGPVRVRVRDGEHALRPGMTGAVGIEVGGVRQGVTVPVASVVYDGAQPVVFVQEGTGHYVPHAVRLGVARDGRVEIASGVDADRRVVTTGAASLLSAERLPGVEEE